MTQKINIAFLTHGDRNIGGGEQSWYFLITKIDRNRFQPVVFYSKKNRMIEKLEKEGVTVVNLEMSQKITSLYRDQVKFNPINLFIYFFCLAAPFWKLFRLLKKHGICILHVHDNLSKIVGVPAAKLAQIKIITHCHDQLGKSFIDRILLSYQRHFMDKIFCVSHYVGHTFAKNRTVPKSVAVVYNGIESIHWTRTEDKKSTSETGRKKIILGVVAVFDKVKGHQYLFEAIQILLSQGIFNFFCLVIGDGRERDNLHQLVLKNRIEKYVKFLGYVSDPKEAMSQLDILIVPSLQESFGIAATEAMSMEIPVIASKVGGLPEVVADGETGILVPSADPDAIAKAVTFMMNHPDKRIEMGRKGRERVCQHFDIDKNLRITEKFIWDLFQEGDHCHP